MPKWKSILLSCAAAVLVVLAVGFRLTAYQGNNLSVGTNDTGSYTGTASKPLFSWHFLTDSRPFTVPLLYKIFQPPGGYQLEVVSEPAILNGNANPAYQPGFDRVALAQMALSILGWLALALALFHRLDDALLKLVGVGMTLLFAFSPQVADWDRILQSESLHLSLFALLLALSIELAHCLSRKSGQRSRWTYAVAGAWLVVMVLWEYTRDANLYAVIISAGVLLAGLAFLTFRSKRLPGITLIVVFGLLLGSVMLHRTTVQASTRWESPLIANLKNNVLPYDTRVQYFMDHGMPYSQELARMIETGVRNRSKYHADQAFVDWLYRDGYSTYTQFLIDTPLWAVQSVFNDMGNLFADNRQPYYDGSSKTDPLWLIPFTGYLHPEFATVIALDILLTALLVYLVLRRPDRKTFVWAVLMAWLLIVEGTLLFIGYHGDFYSKARHAVSSIVPLRYSLWLLILVLADSALRLSKSQGTHHDVSEAAQID